MSRCENHWTRGDAPVIFTRHTRLLQTSTGMRLFSFVLVALTLLGGCTPFIPIKDAFSTSAVKPTGNIPPEFLAFNNFGPQTNALISDQLCATPYLLNTEKSARATPGELVAWRGRCERYEIRLDNLAEHFSP